MYVLFNNRPTTDIPPLQYTPAPRDAPPDSFDVPEQAGNLSLTIQALAYMSADAIANRYKKNPGALL